MACAPRFLISAHHCVSWQEGSAADLFSSLCFLAFTFCTPAALPFHFQFSKKNPFSRAVEQPRQCFARLLYEKGAKQHRCGYRAVQRFEMTFIYRCRVQLSLLYLFSLYRSKIAFWHGVARVFVSCFKKRKFSPPIFFY